MWIRRLVQSVMVLVESGSGSERKCCLETADWSSKRKRKMMVVVVVVVRIVGMEEAMERADRD